jgi:hypothetical protein
MLFGRFLRRRKHPIPFLRASEAAIEGRVILRTFSDIGMDTFAVSNRRDPRSARRDLQPKQRRAGR